MRGQHYDFTLNSRCFAEEAKMAEWGSQSDCATAVNWLKRYGSGVGTTNMYDDACDHDPGPRPRITITLKFWYWGVLRIRVSFIFQPLGVSPKVLRVGFKRVLV